MVETLDDAPESMELLRKRVWRLNTELESYDARFTQARQLVRSLVLTLAKLIPDEAVTTEAMSALSDLKKSVLGNRVNLESVTTVLNDFKTALQAEPTRGEAPVEVPPPPTEDWKERAQSARHLLVAMLQSLRLGRPDFDASLDRIMDELERHLMEGQLRPAMVAVADLLDQYRSTLDQGRKDAEQALQELTQEVFRAEQEFMSSFSTAKDRLLESNKHRDAALDADLAGLGDDLTSATDLSALKQRAIDRITNIRTQLKDRRAEEDRYHSYVSTEMTKLKESLVQSETKLKAAEEKSRRLGKEAVTCSLTGLRNRRAFSIDLEKAIRNESIRPLSLVIFDLDNFKYINDNFGHRSGDKALKIFSDKACSILKESDLVYRYAGDEFVVLLAGATRDEAVKVAERLRTTAQIMRFTYGGKGEFRISISCGVAEITPGESADSFFDRADKALLAAKSQGRNRTIFA